MTRFRRSSIITLALVGVIALAPSASAQKGPRMPAAMKGELNNVNLRQQNRINQMTNRELAQQRDLNTRKFAYFQNKKLKAKTPEEKAQVDTEFEEFKARNKLETELRIEAATERINKEWEAERMLIFQKYRYTYTPRRK